MSTHSEVMHCYEQIAPLTERMLCMARSSQWGGLPALEAQFSDMVAHLQRIESPQAQGVALDEAQSARKLQLLRRINANHAAICGLVMPHLAQLSGALKSLEWQDNLHKAYHQGGHALQ